MAFYAEMVRRGSWWINDANMIFYFKKFLYDEYIAKKERERREYEEWYNSLSDEEREEVERMKIEKQRREHIKTINAMKGLLMIPIVMADVMMRQDRGNYERYGGAYNLDGTPNEDYFRDLSEKNAIDVEAVEVE